VGLAALLPGGQGTIQKLNTYNKNGQLLSESDDLGNATQYEYDSLVRRKRTIFADQTTHETTYNLDGTVKTTRDPNQTVVEHTYDAARRLRRRRAGSRHAPASDRRSAWRCS
jgi:YD repeat-containing protein